MKFEERKRGSSLAELMVVLVILVIVMAVIMAIFSVWWKGFKTTTEKASIEMSISSTMEIISKEIRWSSELEFLEADYNFSEASEGDIFVLLEGNTVKMWKGNRNDVSKLGDNVVDTLLFEVSDPGGVERKPVVRVTLSNTSRGISVTSNIEVLNGVLSGENSGGVVRLKKTDKLWTD